MQWVLPRIIGEPKSQDSAFGDVDVAAHVFFPPIDRNSYALNPVIAARICQACERHVWQSDLGKIGLARGTDPCWIHNVCLTAEAERSIAIGGIFGEQRGAALIASVRLQVPKI